MKYKTHDNINYGVNENCLYEQDKLDLYEKKRRKCEFEI